MVSLPGHYSNTIRRGPVYSHRSVLCPSNGFGKGPMSITVHVFPYFHLLGISTLFCVAVHTCMLTSGRKIKIQQSLELTYFP
jgi:hypothetical protein